MKTEHRRSLISTAEALHRVFWTGTAPRPLLRTRLPHPSQRQQKRHATFTVSSRFVPNHGAPPGRYAQAGPVLDENINARQVHLVSADGKLEPAQPLSSILSSFDRKKYFLVQVSSPDEDEAPVCKILEKRIVRATEAAKAKPVRNAQTMMKQLELNWAIGGNDLGHRLNKMEEFLGQGRRVEVVLGVKGVKSVKKKGRVASKKEAEAVVSRIRAKVNEVEGAREWKPAEGAVGAQMTLYFEGKAKK